MAQPKNPLRPFVGANIPDELRAQSRWAPWRAQWNDKRQKWDKIPCQANGYGLSTAKPERWLGFDAALAAFKARPDAFAGIGYVMTGPHGLVGTDLDGCVNTDGTIEPWAAEVVAALDSYTEVSPSGRGLRIFTTGEVPEDWTNHEIGIEVYAGHEPRFLTVTGDVISGHAEMRQAPADAMAELSTRYARVKTTATVITLQLPDLVDELALPDLAELDIPYQARDFLADGTHRGDRSRELFAAAVALYGAGLRDDEVLSVLAASPHAMEVALDHRRQDADRALMYLWTEHGQKAKGRATSKVATVDDFEDVSESDGKPSVTPGAGPAVKKAMRFAFEPAELFVQGAPVTWMIKRVLPQAEVGVLYGPSGAGKSFLVTDLAMAVATGTAWRGRQVVQGAVAYICAEGAGGFRLRLRALSEHSGVVLAGLPLHILGEAPNLLEKKDVTDLVAALRTLPGLKLIVVDTLAQTTPGANENSGEDMGRALGHCKTLHRATGAMVMLVAHSGKDESRGIRGWSGIKGALDVEIQVERSDKYRAATITKMKDGTGEGDEFAFSLQTVTLGQDADGEDITSCVVQHGASVPKAQRKAEPKGVWQQTVLRVAQGLLDLPGAVTASQLIEAVVAEMPPADDGKKDRRRDNVLRAVEALVAANRISLIGGELAVL
jgi:hypothetical protein